MGPGYYDPDYKSVHTSKGLTISKARRKGPEIENCSPAPNRYFQSKSQSVKRLKKIRNSYTSMKGTFGSASQARFKSRVRENVPGVG